MRQNGPSGRRRPSAPLVLASGSPRRRDLLASLGIALEVRPADVEEKIAAGETAAAGAVRLATAKVEAMRRQRPDALILAADTLVVVDSTGGEEILGKPRDRADARRMLRLLSGREHRVLTGLALGDPHRGLATDLGSTVVRFAELSGELVDWYIGTGEPMDKAGAYGVQGSAALFVAGLDGSWSNVVGLPLERLPALFRAAGQDLLDRLEAA